MDEDLIYIDTRNADHRDRSRTLVPARAVTVQRDPHPRVQYSPPPPIVPTGFSAPGFPIHTSVSYPQPTIFGSTPIYSPGPIYGQPPFMNQLGSLFGGLNLGDVISLGLEAFAAFKGLPAAPTPTEDVATDIANNVTFIGALAREFKLDKQLELGGRIAGRLAGGMLGAR